jgi:serine/threonine-protein phosphatase 2A activator
MSLRTLEQLPNISEHKFEKPTKRIHDGPDVQFFLTTYAYRDVMTFILQLNHAMVARRDSEDQTTNTQKWTLDSPDMAYSDPVHRLRVLLDKIESLIKDAPPDTGPRRFGNISFRTWYKLVDEQVHKLLAETLPQDHGPAIEEVAAYLMGSFGSPQRLDYGTGHELSFLAFLGCLWKVDFFQTTSSGSEERGIVLGVFEPYLRLVRVLIKTYSLEPAGSHGVWGLDDNSFLPYVFGSAQLSPAITETAETPTEGSLPDAPEPSSVSKANLVDKEKSHNMYFSAIAFIFDVKKGPFWEHSPMLFDISGIKDGWGKINKGMIKMYNAEVLSKFPVVQHFPFGSLFRWEKDSRAKPPPVSTHSNSQPLRNPMATPSSLSRPGGLSGTAAPWATTTARPAGFVNGVTQAPWASRGPAPPRQSAANMPLRRPEPGIPEKPNQSQGS